MVSDLWFWLWLIAALGWWISRVQLRMERRHFIEFLQEKLGFVKEGDAWVLHKNPVNAPRPAQAQGRPPLTPRLREIAEQELAKMRQAIGQKQGPA